MAQPKKLMSKGERKAATALIYGLVLGWLMIAVEILILRKSGEYWGLTVLWLAPLVVLPAMILLLVSMGGTLLGLVLVFRRRYARGLGITLLLLSAVPLVKSTLDFDNTVGESRDQTARRKYQNAVKDRYPEIRAKLEQPVQVVRVHDFGDCAVIEISGGLGLVVDRRGSDNQVRSIDELRRQVETTEIRAEVPPKFAFIPVTTGIKKLKKSETITFACGVWLGSDFWRQGTCWP